MLLSSDLKIPGYLLVPNSGSVQQSGICVCQRSNVTLLWRLAGARLCLLSDPKSIRQSLKLCQKKIKPLVLNNLGCCMDLC